MAAGWLAEKAGEVLASVEPFQPAGNATNSFEPAGDRGQRHAVGDPDRGGGEGIAGIRRDRGRDRDGHHLPACSQEERLARKAPLHR